MYNIHLIRTVEKDRKKVVLRRQSFAIDLKKIVNRNN